MFNHTLSGDSHFGSDCHLAARLPTPEPTVTPEPQIAPEIEAAQEFFADKGFEITPEGKVIDQKTGTEIAGLTIVPFDEKTMINRKRPSDPDPKWAIERIYEFDVQGYDKTEMTVNMTEYDIKVEDGAIDMFGWTYKEGTFTRDKVKFAAPNNGIVELEGYSPEEVQYLIIKNSSNKDANRITGFQALRKLSFNVSGTVVNGTPHTTYKGMLEPMDFNVNLYGTNFVPKMEGNGQWSEIKTATYLVYQEFKDRNKVLVVWIDKNNNPVIVVMEAKWLDMPKYFNRYWETHDIKDPFTP